MSASPWKLWKQQLPLQRNAFHRLSSELNSTQPKTISHESLPIFDMAETTVAYEYKMHRVTESWWSSFLNGQLALLSQSKTTKKKFWMTMCFSSFQGTQRCCINATTQPLSPPYPMSDAYRTSNAFLSMSGSFDSLTLRNATSQMHTSVGWTMK